MDSFIFNIMPEYLINSAGISCGYLANKGKLYGTLINTSLNYDLVKDYKTLSEFNTMEIKNTRQALYSSIDSYANNEESSSATYYQAYDIPCSSIIFENPTLSAYKYLNNYSSGYNSDEYLYFDIQDVPLVSDTSCILLDNIDWNSSNIYAEGLLIYACNNLLSDDENVPLAYYNFWKPIKSISGDINIEWDNRGVITIK